MYRKASMEEEEEGSVSCVVVAEQTGSDSSLFHQSWSLGIKLSSFARLSIPRQRGDSCKMKKTANTLSAGPIGHPLSSPLG